MKLLLTGISIFFFSLLQAQQAPNHVSIRVKNLQEMPVESATVELLQLKDSSLVKTALTDANGTAQFEGIIPGEYVCRASLINYEIQYSSSFVLGHSDVIVPAITLIKNSVNKLENVTVVAKKPFIQKLSDRLVVNVDNSLVNAGSTAFEILERSPGVNIDNNDAISLRGKTGVIIFIDGKPSPMTGADLAAYLRSLPSNAIDRVELITNPSAKYDAAGNAGIIDIKLKKDQRLGMNGTFTTGYGQGVYPKANAGATFNYRNKKLNVFGNYNYSYRKNLNHLILNRNFYNNGKFIGSDDKDNYTTFPFNTHTARLGADLSASKKTIIGFVINTTFNKANRSNDNNSVINGSDNKPFSTFATTTRSNDHFDNIVSNINFKHSFDTTGRELTADADYGVFRTDNMSTISTGYYKLDGTAERPDYILLGDQDGRLTIKSVKADYVNPIGNLAKLEAGVKTSFVSSDNDSKFFDNSTGIPQNDTTKTNHFFYDENNLAGYLNFSKEFKKFNIQVGLRGEQTKIKTRQAKGDARFDSSYFQLFPSTFFNYKISADKTIGASVSRRIDRPGYSQLNPFLFLIDVSTYSTGRPGLLPQLTWAYEISYSQKNFNISASHSHTRQNMTTVIIPFKDVFPHIVLSDSNVTVQIPVNLSSSDYYGISVSAPLRINSWWNMTNNADFYYIHFNGTLANTPLNNGTPAARININNAFNFKKGWTAELSSNYSSRFRNGFMVIEPQWGVGFGVQKNILKNKGTIRFNMTDIFWTNLPRATITYNHYIENWHAFRETRVANLSFTYRFGNNKVAASRRRTTASEEERRRAGG